MMRALILLLVLIVNPACAASGPAGLLGVQSATEPMLTTPVRPDGGWKDFYSKNGPLRMRMTWQEDATRGLFVRVEPVVPGCLPIGNVTYSWKRADGRSMHAADLPVLVNGGRGGRVRIPLPAPHGARFDDAGTAGVRYIITARIELVAPLFIPLGGTITKNPRDEIVAITPSTIVAPMH